MPELDENDIIIRIADELRTAKANDFSIEYAILDNAFHFPEGTTLKHIEAAAEDAELEIVRKGSTRASLRKKSNFGFA